MGLGSLKQKTYLSIKDGKIRKIDPHTKQETYYEFVEGILNSITTPKRDYGKIWEFEILDPKTNDTYALTMSYNSGVAKSILNCLASIKGTPEIIKIKPYFVNGFNKVAVYNNGVKLNWKYTQFPKIKKIEVEGKTFLDDTERVNFFEMIAEELRKKISNKGTKYLAGWDTVFKNY
jgi:hypothetical protein